MKKYYKYGLIVLALLMFTLLMFLWWKNNNVSSVAEKEKQFLPITPELQAKLDQHNLRMQTLKEAEEKYQKNKTDAQLEAEKKFAKKLATVSESMLGEINFYGQAVDQHGDPIVGARIRYDAGGATFAKGSGKGETISDENGLFIVKGKGQSLLVSLSQKNHEFLPDYRFASFVDPEHPVAWPDYNVDNPYIFNGWKIESYPKIKTNRLLGLIFKPDGRTYTWDLLKPNNKEFRKGENEGDILISFNRDDQEWELTLSAIDGGIIETEDMYMNLAPESGYQSTLTYSGSNNEYEVKKKLYFNSRNQTVYGWLNLRIRPVYREVNSAINLTYVINLEQGRNLTVKQQR